LPPQVLILTFYQCCGSETFLYGFGSDFSMSSGSGSYFQKVPVSDPTFFMTKYDFEGPKMAFQNIIFKEFLNFEYKNGQNYEITPFLMVFVNVYIYFRIWTRIWNPRVTDPEPAKVPDPCRSGSTTLLLIPVFVHLRILYGWNRIRIIVTGTFFRINFVSNTLTKFLVPGIYSK
jgi:hypothetical protein